MSNDNMSSDMVILQAATFMGAVVTYVMPIVSIIFMIVSIISGSILIYKFFTNKK